MRRRDLQHSFYSLYSLAALAVHSSSLVAPAPPSPHADQLQGGSKRGIKWEEGETCSHLPFIGQLFKRRTRKTFTDKRRKLWTRLWAPLSVFSDFAHASVYSAFSSSPSPSLSPCQVFSRCDLCFINIKSDLLAMKFVRALANLDERRESFSAPVPFSF